MGLFQKLAGELVDIIEWLDDSGRTLVWRFPRFHNQIKNGARLIVRPGQVAVFVTEGRLADVFEPGLYELKTNNLPILSTLMGWKHGFDSPFKSEVYFVSTRQVTDLKWGTPNPLMLRDPDFGPIRLRAFGTYTLRAREPKALLKELVGTDGVFETDEVSELMRSVIANAFAQVIGEAQLAALDLAANYQKLADTLKKRVVEQVDDEYGLEVPALFIVNISFPEEVERALDARSSMGMLGNLQQYQQYQMGNAMVAAARNPGAASDALGMGMGLAMASQMAHAAQGFGATAAVPPPPPGSQIWHVHLRGQSSGPFPAAQLQQMLASGQITPDALVWTAGMSAWQPAASVAALAATLPPPPPR